MKVFCISDTHMHHGLLTIPKDIDMIIHAGDSTNYYSWIQNQPEFEQFWEWFVYLPIRYKVLIAGNHDGHIDKYKDSFSSIQDTLNLSFDDGVRIFCSHYAHRVWHHSHKGVIHLYGHSHASIDDNYGKSMDVGIDNAYKLYNEYRMFSLEEIIKIMSKRNINFVDHHKPATN